eukprot:gene11982-12126_t
MQVINASNNVSCSHHGGHTVLVGFQQATVAGAVRERAQNSTALRGARSLLSELLLKEEVVQMALDCASSQPSEDMEAEQSEGSQFEEEDWTWFDGASTVHSSHGDCSSSQASQPINIPAISYFKDDVQRQALEKLNQKRKWYQQQLEAERMMARSMAKSRQ